MTRSRWFGWLLVAVAVGACAPGAATTGQAPAPSPGGSPSPTAAPSATASSAIAAPSAGGSPQASTSPSPVAGCPDHPTLADVIAIDRDPGPLTVAFRPIYGHYAEAALACYPGSELRFIAFMAAPEGLGGVEDYRIEPLWLTGRGHWLAVDDAVAPEGSFAGPFLAVAVRPGDAAAFEGLRGTWVEVRGHFSDAAAETCRVTFGDPPVAPSPEQAIDICRTAFVVTGSQPVPRPSPAQ